MVTSRHAGYCGSQRPIVSSSPSLPAASNFQDQRGGERFGVAADLEQRVGADWLGVGEPVRAGKNREDRMAAATMPACNAAPDSFALDRRALPGHSCR